MTPDELARVPEGGATWKRIKFGTQVHLNGKWLCDCGYNDKDARQIVGSVNATILRNRFGWPSTKQPLDEEGKQIERDIDFWSRYAKGNA